MASLEQQIQNSLLPIEACTGEVGGFCVDNTYAKGTVLYYHLDSCSWSFINLPGLNLLPNWLLAVMWGLFLFWAFFGIAIISDAFVEGIEVITSITKKVKRHDSKGNEVWREEPIWNWAVANITLLAVGGSSPEILLAIVETLLTLGQPAGEIGPATIVGSGSYNLFAITAVCTIALPAGQFKGIEHMKVFIWTTSWSLWAHLWLWIVYKKITPDEITIWEAWVTLGFMPVFVYTTWLVDTRGWNWFAAHKHSIVSPDDETDEENGEGKSTDDAATALKRSPSQAVKHSILFYRSMAVQHMGGMGNKAKAGHDLVHSDTMEKLKKGTEPEQLDMAAVEAMGKEVPKVMLKSPEISVLESVGEARLQVLRLHGDPGATLKVKYTCKDDTAVAGLDYEHSEGTLVFGPGETTQDIVIKIVDDDMSEPDVAFIVQLTTAEVDGGGEVVILRRQTAVTIVDDDDGGVVMFELPTWEAGVLDQYAEVAIIRRHGADGRVTVDYSTKDGSAQAGKHFKDVSGTLVFNTGETKKTVQVPLLPVANADTAVVSPAFRVSLSNPLGGVVLGARKDCRVVLVPGSKGKLVLSSGDGSEDGDDEEEFELWSAWQDRFKEAVLPEYDEEDNVWLAIFLHYVSVTYKLIAACIPPAEWRDGYPTFIIALGILGMLMAVVKEAASMFGCALGLSELMTGMSIVALGTSLPDTFASRLAAINDDTADAAIGNIMGSNSCNVFLGLGIPWVIATAYYTAKHEPYDVKAGALGFALMIFFILAVVSIGILLYRRQCGGELGATTRKGQWYLFASFIACWLVFLMLTGLYDYGHIPDAGF